MKKLVSLVIVMALLVAAAFSVAAAEFVPSISYKDHPDVVGDPDISVEDGTEDGLDILITPVSDAIETEQDDRNEAEQELAEVYEALTDGGMTLPFPDNDKDYVIRDLIDVSLIVKNDDPNAEPEFSDLDARVVLTFDLGVKPDAEVLVYVYADENWKLVEEVVNNGDGTITVTLEKLGVLSFCVEDELVIPPSPTFDKMSGELTTWIVLMAVSSCALIVMLALRRKVRS